MQAAHGEQRTLPPQPGSAPARRFDARAQRRRIEAAFRRPPSTHKLALLALAFVWGAALAYYLFVPSTYVSKWTMIVPTSNSSSSVTLESIGQASTQPSQPFGTLQLSPKVIYREIASSDQVRKLAAQMLSIDPRRMGKIRIKSVDETSMLMFQITGSSPEMAQSQGRALIEALGQQLDQLRRDEQEKRARIVRDNLKLYQANLATAQARILEFQRETGLLSLNQFNESSSTAELLRRKQAEHRTEIERLGSEQARLMSRLGFEPAAAAAGLRMAADPAFAKLAASFAESAVAVHENNRLYGPNHPARVLARAKGESAFAELTRIAREARIDPSIDLRSLLLMMNSSHQSELVRTIVANEAAINGRRSESKAIETELARIEADVARLGAHAARLEALKKDHLVAEAVLTSAMARLDTNRADLYSSYPLLQVLAEPDLPESRTQPRLSYAIAAGLVGTLLVLMAWGALWIGASFSPRRQRNG
jgi:capsule polysaccharide export protein KpsE/RkpR